MGRSAKSAKSKVEAKLPAARRSLRGGNASAYPVEKRLAQALEQQAATSEILRVISKSPADLQPVFDAIVRSASRLCDGQHAIVVRVDGDWMHLAASFNARSGTEMNTVFPRRIGREIGIGRAILDAAPVHIPDVEKDPEYSHEVMRALGLRSSLSVPLLREGRPIGGIGVSRAVRWPFAENNIELMKTFADQAVIAIENARLFREIEAKSRLLEKASQHKSEFLANMSHELRTPLNAIIGFSEVLSERLFGEINEKQAEYVRDILESGKHLLSLINEILDLSKIEAGRMDLEAIEFDLPSAIENTLILVMERAQRRAITLLRDVDEHLGVICADERKVKQVLLNLLSNALKFTPEGGQINVRATVHGGQAEISVTDTGPGIAPDDQEAVFEEFRQLGTAATKAGGTGLGLAISRKFIELHGGKIWVTSRMGTGSTFSFTLPLR